MLNRVGKRSWLHCCAENGHSDDDVAKIMQRVMRYESDMQLDSVMASIGDGTLDLTAIVREALGKEPPPDEA